jgi:hypothetical protein
MAVTLSRWDASEYLDSAEMIQAYINEALADSDPRVLQAALGDIAKAKGMSEIAKQAGVGRESLYKSLSMTGNPSWQTISKVLRSLGYKLELTPTA